MTTLSGGERVITERVDGVRSASIGLWIGAGSRDESVAKAGVSHFIEHLLFKGTERFDAVRIAELFDNMGGELNAATSRETTVVYTRVPDDHIDDALDVMTDMVFSPPSTDIDSEREVVLEEIAMVGGQPPGRRPRPRPAEAVFGAHPLGRPVIGRGGGDLVDLAALAARLPPGRVRGGPTSCWLRRATSTTTGSPAILAERRNGGAPRRRPSALGSRLGQAPLPEIRFQRKSTEQYHVCLAGPGSLAETIHGGMRLRCSMPFSAAPHPPGSSRRSVRSGGWPTPSTRTDRNTWTPARSGSTSAHVRRTWRECLDVIAGAASGTSVRAISGPGARAGEGEHEGPSAARRSSRPPRG